MAVKGVICSIGYLSGFKLEQKRYIFTNTKKKIDENILTRMEEKYIIIDK